MPLSESIEMPSFMVRFSWNISVTYSLNIAPSSLQMLFRFQKRGALEVCGKHWCLWAAEKSEWLKALAAVTKELGLPSSNHS